ncbi:MAG: DUF3140 domain-containing protein [Myxococcales bacterium]|nr:DUF3140 domain-containing protein [Sphingomicrobium sp.]
MAQKAAEEPSIAPLDRERIAAGFARAVNMTADELREWLASDLSVSVGWKGVDGMLHESVGHASGRWIADILETPGFALTDADYCHMRKVVGFIRRHLAQEPANPVTSRWRYSLMNWGHDPLKG